MPFLSARFFRYRIQAAERAAMGAALLPFLIENQEWFLLHKKQWLDTLHNMELCTPDFVKELQTESYSQFQDAFLRLTIYSFLHNSLSLFPIVYRMFYFSEKFVT